MAVVESARTLAGEQVEPRGGGTLPAAGQPAMVLLASYSRIQNFEGLVVITLTSSGQ